MQTILKSPFAVAMAIAGLLVVPVFASDDDGKPDSHSFDLEISQVFGKTIVIHAWDTITFRNNSDEAFTATFLAGSEPLADEPANMVPTRERGTYWDGASVLNSGKLSKDGTFWATILETGTYEYYNILNPDQLAWVVVVPKTKHIPNEGAFLDAAAIAADPVLVELVEANK